MDTEGDAQVDDPGVDIQTVMKLLAECQNRCSILENERRDLLSGFEEKRAKFKEVYQAKEKLIGEQALEVESLRVRLKQNEEKISSLRMELKDLQLIASVSENTKQEAVDNLEKRHQDEMESLRKAMEESNEESQRDMVRHFERERQQWEKNLSSIKYDKEALEMQLDEARKRIAHDTQFTEEEELEASMKMAHAEAEKLKSVILPLENEISNLKEELEKTKSELEESRKVAAELGAKAVKAEETSRESENVTENKEAMIELDQSLKSEKSSRTDIERYVEVLQEQKKVIENDRDDLQEKILHLRKQFELEKEEHTVLKQTWLAANDQFLEAQRLLMRDNNIIEGVLSEDQRRQVKMLKLKAQASEAREVPAKSPMSSLALLKMKTDKFKEAAADSFSQKSDEESDSQSFGSYQEFQDAADAHQQKVSLQLSLPDSKSHVITEKEYIDANKIVPGPGQIVVSETEWNDMLREIRLTRNKAARITGGTSLSTPGKKHADLFDDDAKMTEEIEALTTRLTDYERERLETAETTKSLEESIRCSAEDGQKQITDLSNKMLDFERLLGNLKERQIKVKAEDINTMVSLQKEKDKYRDELFSFKKERNRIMQLEDKHQQTLLKEAPSSKSPEAIQSMFAAYRQTLAKTRAEKDNLETKLKNEIAFLEERLKAEQGTRDQLEASLASELHDARGEIISLQSLKSVNEDLEKALEEKKELELQIEKSKTSYEALQAKSKDIIKGLRDKHLAEIKAKEDLQSSLADAKNRFQSLHSALETSETVQRDFVRLSQSLQVELEQVRQERERERRSDADTSSDKSLELPTANTQPVTEDGEKQGGSPALTPKSERKTEPQKSS